jgi:hypothetical protein
MLRRKAAAEIHRGREISTQSNLQKGFNLPGSKLIINRQPINFSKSTGFDFLNFVLWKAK